MPASPPDDADYAPLLTPEEAREARFVVTGMHGWDLASDVEAICQKAGWPCKQVTSFWAKRGGETKVVVSAAVAPPYIRCGDRLVQIRAEADDDRRERRPAPREWKAPKGASYRYVLRGATSGSPPGVTAAVVQQGAEDSAA
ncbi:hypothetical protein DIPPA_26719 [Diplonema papillatum]|nr:hypothetical protein DIPPA_26719 [Diplonema papillatum]